MTDRKTKISAAVLKLVRFKRGTRCANSATESGPHLFFFTYLDNMSKNVTYSEHCLQRGAKWHQMQENSRYHECHVLVNVENSRCFKNRLDIRSREDDPVLEGLN